MKTLKIFITALMVFSLVHVQVGINTMSLISVQVSVTNVAYADGGTYQGEETGSGSGIMDWITGAAIGVIAGSLIRCKGKTPDTIAVAIGGAS